MPENCTLAIDLPRGSFQVCSIGRDGAVLDNRVRSRARVAALLAEQKPALLRWKLAPPHITRAVWRSPIAMRCGVCRLHL